MMKCYPVSHIATEDYTKRVENQINFVVTLSNYQAYISYWLVTQSLFPEQGIIFIFFFYFVLFLTALLGTTHK